MAYSTQHLLGISKVTLDVMLMVESVPASKHLFESMFMPLLRLKFRSTSMSMSVPETGMVV